MEKRNIRFAIRAPVMTIFMLPIQKHGRLSKIQTSMIRKPLITLGFLRKPRYHEENTVDKSKITKFVMARDTQQFEHFYKSFIVQMYQKIVTVDDIFSQFILSV